MAKPLCYQAFVIVAAGTDPDPFAPCPPPVRHGLPAGDPDTHPLLQPLAEAQDAVARLEASAAAASPAVVAGLRARVAYREAAGWLAHTHTWVHPRDLALRDAGVTGSYTVAAMAGHLAAELPTMTALGTKPDTVPADEMAGTALRLARVWRRLGEHRTWRPVADAAAVRETLASLGWAVMIDDTAIEEWLYLAGRRDQGPALIRAGHGARDWMNRQGHADPVTIDGLFLAACLWRDAGYGRDTPCPSGRRQPSSITVSPCGSAPNGR